MKDKPTILAIETSTDACSVALLHQERVFSRHEIAPREHVRIVLPRIEELFQEAGVTLKECDAIAFGRGPGSFTGLRIAASIAQGLAFGAQLPVIGISSLQILAQTAVAELTSQKLPITGKNILVISDARMQEVYWGCYQITSEGLVIPLQEDALDPPAQITINTPIDYAIGNGWTHYPSDLMHLLPHVKKNITIDYPNATALLQLAKQEFLQEKGMMPHEALPVYIRDKVTHS